MNPKTLVILKGRGRFVWDPVAQMIDFIETGKRTKKRSWYIRKSDNNKLGALRKIGKIMQGIQK